MDRLIFAMGLVGATVILVPADQSVPQQRTDWHGAQVAHSTFATPAQSGVEQTDLNLTPGSQQPVYARIALEAPQTTSNTWSNAYSATMHDLAARMLDLPPQSQQEIVWLVKALASEPGVTPPPPTGANLTDHLHQLAQFIGDLSNEDRKVVVDLAESLARN